MRQSHTETVAHSRSVRFFQSTQAHAASALFHRSRGRQTGRHLARSDVFSGFFFFFFVSFYDTPLTHSSVAGVAL